jgi:hypothetical protein
MDEDIEYPEDRLQRRLKLIEFEREVMAEDIRFSQLPYVKKLIEAGDYMSDGSDSGMTIGDNDERNNS